MSVISQLVKKHPAFCFLTLALVLGAAPLTLVAVGVAPSGFAQLGALSASTAGILLAASEDGRQGVWELVRRGLVWQVGLGWWVIALLYMAGIAVVALYIAHFLGGPPVEWDGAGPVWNVLPIMVVLIVLAGLGEEFGWRGFLLPRLQVRHNALVSSLIIGVLHSVWHIPLFLVSGSVQREWAQQLGLTIAFLGYSVFVIAWAIQLTWVFNNTRGSVLLVATVHGAGNAWIGGYFYTGRQTDMLAIAALSLSMAVVSIIIVIIAGPTHLSRTSERNILQIAEERAQSGAG